MKNFIFVLFSFLICFSLASCEIIGDIFQTGIGVGIFISAVVVIAVIAIIAKVRGGKGS